MHAFHKNFYNKFSCKSIMIHNYPISPRSHIRRRKYTNFDIGQIIPIKYEGIRSSQFNINAYLGNGNAIPLGIPLCLRSASTWKTFLLLTRSKINVNHLLSGFHLHNRKQAVKIIYAHTST